MEGAMPMLASATDTRRRARRLKRRRRGEAVCGGEARS
jgi:hypothetical protein